MLFGDMLSFDNTYHTNRYDLVLGLFTGVDHHGKCVTFATSLLAHEDKDSFIWVFDQFLKAMWNHEPICIITDQDPAMLPTLEIVFKDRKAKYRLCMWHIMKKVLDKVSQDVRND